MYADVVTTVVLEVQSNPTAQKCECYQEVQPLGSSRNQFFDDHFFIYCHPSVVEGKRDALDAEVFAERLELMLQ